MISQFCLQVHQKPSNNIPRHIPVPTMNNACTSVHFQSLNIEYYFCRSYDDGNKKPLLDSPEKDEDSWSGWGDGWGSKASPGAEEAGSAGGRGAGAGAGGAGKTQPEDDGDAWGSWSNEGSPSPAAGKTDQDDAWNNDDWGTGTGLTTTTATSATTTSTTKKSSSTSNHKKSSSSRSKHHKKHAKKTGEPATANLIDFGENNTEPAAQNNDGWDNEVWAQEDDDDVWQSLELDSSSSKAKASWTEMGETTRTHTLQQRNVFISQL